MKIKISKNYYLCYDLYKTDMERIRQHESFTYSTSYYPTFTYSTSYSPTWETVDVTLEQLQEYVNKGYPIMINC